MMKKTELLAPAGSLEGLKAVIYAGADAVYIGGSRFGARAYADNPDETSLIEGIEFAHLRGRKVYLTVNTLLKQRETEQLYDYILPYYECGVDGVLVQDFGVLKFLHEYFPDLPLHASTQMTVTGPEWSDLLKQYGVTRVVPARELSLIELKRIKDETGLEVEVFIHGALCVSYSGQCLYSSILGGRSGNRGRCAQPCRLLYLKDDKTGFDGTSSILERKEARHFLSPKDLNGIEEIPDLISAGMDSLKIEGRMKQPEYAAGVVSIYRKYLDLAYSGKTYRVSKEDRDRLYDLYNRSGFTDGYLKRHNGPEMMAYVKHELTSEETAKRHELYDKVHEKFLKEDLKVSCNGVIEVFSGKPIRLFLKSGNASVSVSGKKAERAKNRPLNAERIAENIRKTGGTDFVIKDLQVRTDDTSFVPVSSLNEIRRDGLQALREEMCRPFRREKPACQDSDSKESAADSGKKKGAETPQGQRNLKISALVSTKEQLEAALMAEGVDLIYVESFLLHEENRREYLSDCMEKAKKSGTTIWIAMPYIDRAGSDEREIKESASDLIQNGLGGFLVRSPETAAFFIRKNLTEFIRTDAGLYTFNQNSRQFFRNFQIQKDTAPIELNRKELSHRDNFESELIAYGRIPLMISAQCLEKNTNRCTRQNAEHVLTDRMGAKFPIKCVCDFCYNIVYNSLPLSLIGESDRISEMGFSRIRLQFTDEKPDQMLRIIRMARNNCLTGSRDDLEGDYTKGHFSRGVE